jgi:hypothetical protein
VYKAEMVRWIYLGPNSICAAYSLKTIFGCSQKL